MFSLPFYLKIDPCLDLEKSGSKIKRKFALSRSRVCCSARSIVTADLQFNYRVVSERYMFKL